MWRCLNDELISRLLADRKVSSSINELEKSVEGGTITPGQASDEVLKLFLRDKAL